MQEMDPTLGFKPVTAPAFNTQPASFAQKPLTSGVNFPATNTTTPNNSGYILPNSFPLLNSAIAGTLGDAPLGGVKSSITPTVPKPSTGFTFSPTLSTGFNTSPSKTTLTPAAPAAQTTLGGGQLSPSPAGGTASYTPAPTFSIDTSSAVPSAALQNSITSSDLAQRRNQYADYIQALANAQGYSPAYQQALQAVQQNQAQKAQLEANLAFGGAPGDTLQYAQGATAKAEVANSIAGLGAQQALQVQTLLRQGNIAAASALVDAYKPQSVSPGSALVSPVTGQETYSGLGGYTGVQAVQQFYNYKNNYPDAQIPEYDFTKDPQTNLQLAQQAAAQSPSFQARNTYLETLAGGQVVAYNKNTGQQQVIQSAADASMAQALNEQLKTNQAAKSNTEAAVQTADANFPLLLQAAKDAGVNNNSPLINQLEQKFGMNFTQSPALAQFNVMVSSLQAEYTRILNRQGGSPTDQERATSQALINGTYSLGQLQAVYQTVKKESANVIAGYDSQIQAANDGLDAIYSRASQTANNAIYNQAQSSGSNSGVGSSWDNLVQ